MRYTFLLYSNPALMANLTDADRQREIAAYATYIGALTEAGVLVATDWLQPAMTATTLSVENGERRIQNGPFAETQETLGGYFAIEAPDLDAAMAWAEKCPAAHYGKVEIRASAMGGT